MHLKVASVMSTRGTPLAKIPQLHEQLHAAFKLLFVIGVETGSEGKSDVSCLTGAEKLGTSGSGVGSGLLRTALALPPPGTVFAEFDLHAPGGGHSQQGILPLPRTHSPRRCWWARYDCLATASERILTATREGGRMHQGGCSGSGLTAASSPEDHVSEQQRLQPIPPAAAYGGDDDDLETPPAYSYAHGSMYTVPLQHYAYDDAAGPADDGGGGGEFQSPPGGGPSTASYAPDYVSPAYSYDSYDSTSEYHHGTLLASVESARWETQGAQFAGAATAGLDHVDPSFDALYTPPAPPASYAGPSSVSSRPSTSRERPRTADSVILPASNGITHPIPSVRPLASMISPGTRADQVIP